MRTLRIVASILALGVAACMLSGCGGGEPTYVPVIAPNGSFTVSIANTYEPAVARARQSGSSQSVYYPDSAQYTVTVTGSGGFTGNVALAVRGLIR